MRLKLGDIISYFFGLDNKYYLYSLFTGSAEKEMERKRTRFYSQFLKEGDTFFDVGANLGNRIKPALNLKANVIAIEPDKYCASFLKKKFGGKIKLVNKGLAAEEGVLEMFISSVHSSISTFSTKWMDVVKSSGRFKDSDWKKRVKIPMTTLDNVIAEHGAPDFIKIDVEGFESEVLSGLTKPVKYISFEYAVPEMADAAIQCIMRIRQNSADISCNYSVGESMEWGLSNWLSVEDMISYIKTEEFQKTSSGDIYIKLGK